MKKVSFIIVILILIIFVYGLVTADSYVRGVISEREKWIQNNNSTLQAVFIDVFPQARRCLSNKPIPNSFNKYKDYCNGTVRKHMDNMFYKTLGTKYDSGRTPVYFIRLEDSDHIGKLFQSGTYFVEEVDTREEKYIVELLQGKQDTFPFPQFTCNGGDDIFCDTTGIDNIISRTYLKDFPSETELIFPIKNNKQEIIGGLVYLHGD